MADYPIPELASESINFLDYNKTILDSVDMDTTQALSEDIIVQQMEFESEPSQELKFDASSLLQRLRSKPSDRCMHLPLLTINTFVQGFTVNQTT